MNETLETIGKRYSCRDYDSALPEKEKLEDLWTEGVNSFTMHQLVFFSKFLILWSIS